MSCMSDVGMNSHRTNKYVQQTWLPPREAVFLNPRHISRRLLCTFGVSIAGGLDLVYRNHVR